MAILGPQVSYSLCVLFPEEIMGRLYRRSLSGGGPVRHTPLNPESHGLQGDVPGTQARRGMFRMPLWVQAPQSRDVEPSLNRSFPRSGHAYISQIIISVFAILSDFDTTLS
jgi:hypothetical protein